MDENNIVELLWMNGQIVLRETQNTTSDKPSPSPPVFRSGVGGEGNPLLLHDQTSHENIFTQEDEMAYWLHHPHFYSDVLYSEVVSSQPLSYVSHAPPPPPIQELDQPPLDRKAENFMSFSRLRDSLLTSGRVESVGPSMAMVKESTLVVSNATPSSLVIDQSYIAPPATHVATTTGVVSQTFVVPGIVRKGKAVATTEPVRELAGSLPKKPKEDHGSKTSRKRPRASAMHNLSERRRREKINKNMKDLKELIPRCNKTDKASMLEEAIQYIKSLEMQIQMMMLGGGGMMSIMYREDVQRFMPHMAMSINRGPPFTPFPRPAHISPPYPWPPRYPFPNFQAFDPASNQPSFPGYLNPYSQFVGPQQMQPPPPMQNQTTLQLNLSQASSSSKEPEKVK